MNRAETTELSVNMKRLSLLLVFLLAISTFAAAQTQTRERRSSDTGSAPNSDSTTVRSRVVAPVRVSNHSDKPNQNPTDNKTAMPAWGNTVIAAESAAKENSASRRPDSSNKAVTRSDQNSGTHPRLIQQTAMITEAPSVRLIAPPVNAAARPNGTARTSLPSRSLPATMLYRVGIGDVLDIRLANMPTRESTLFTVRNPGVVEYPLLSGPVGVEGLTTDEIAALLSREIKVIDHPIATVTVRDYASHAVTITGLVDSPGKKVLRREAMPLYTVIAEALPRPEATAVTITRGGKNESLSMTNEQSMATLVTAGDIIRVSGEAASSKRFVYVGGDVAATGEREFREGMTLTQALLAAGGVARSDKASAKVARRNASGFLVTNEYNVRAIEEGKAPDPVLEAGDRIEVRRGVW
jgi:protein involved in polysaccharide export with SLBB domain